MLRCFGTKWLQSSKVDNLGLQPERVEQKYLASFLNSGLDPRGDRLDVNESQLDFASISRLFVDSRKARLVEELENLRYFFRNRPSR